MTTNQVPPVAVAGATGFTGRLVTRALASRGTPVRLVGRSAKRLQDAATGIEGCETRAVPEWDEAGLVDAVTGCGALVACAGPFIEVGEPVVRAAIKAGVPYCDSTGEQAFIRFVFEELDAPAREAGVPLVPAFGFDYVPGDLAAAIAGEGLGPLERVDVVYVIEAIGTSPGTRMSAIEMIGRPVYQYVDGALRRDRIGAHRVAVDTPIGPKTGGSAPCGEAITVPRHLDVRNVISYLALPVPLGPASPLAPLGAAMLALPGVGAALKQAAALGPRGPSDREREGRVFVVVRAVARDGKQRELLVEGRDIYGFTANALTELATRFAGHKVAASGALAPAQVVEPRAFLEAMGFTVREVDGA